MSEEMTDYDRMRDALEKEERCKKCRNKKSHPVYMVGGGKILGCYQEPYNGKWIAEIEDCPIGETKQLHTSEDWI